ncbi:SIS domain-containing protein [Bailinhaonella thermotolerans]|uniref:Glutamine--fructose-6-phosphate aminotransferase [isomerizing] n=1 Tax=Bailinhaonella thermotolerans TaxID=1070861 RepID=A0A3A4A3X3_9ACTN|nr:SIS domain-containing protein [Bailinhaonella thermotolerans]RJL23175.1 SIS domain-containing protein [Bailinhaonella thermotolerans]
MTPFERDITDQPAALERLLAAERAHPPLPLLHGGEKIVVTGMGSSLYAGYPTWRRLLAAGADAWWISASELLDNPTLAQRAHLAIVTSQSGRSGEVLALLDQWDKAGPRHVIGVTDDPDSPLARRSHLVRPLHSGPEATVSTKSYLNTLAAHALLAGELTGDPLGPVISEIRLAAAELARALRARHPSAVIAAAATGAGSPRLALLGGGDQAATALTGALILKEAAKVPAEAFVGGAFRHGPIELAGPGLTAVMLTGPGSGRDSLAHLAADLAPTGTTLVTIGPHTLPGVFHHIPTPQAGRPADLILPMLAIQRLAVALARATGVEPGHFHIGQKVTQTL